MSNNKQSMKLYTEEQVRQAMDFARGHHRMSDTQFIETLTPIELPSDEEINEVAMVVYGFNARDVKDVLEYKAFKRGAKNIIDKIQGGNK